MSRFSLKQQRPSIVRRLPYLQTGLVGKRISLPSQISHYVILPTKHVWIDIFALFVHIFLNILQELVFGILNHREIIIFPHKSKLILKCAHNVKFAPRSIVYCLLLIAIPWYLNGDLSYCYTIHTYHLPVHRSVVRKKAVYLMNEAYFWQFLNRLWMIVLVFDGYLD